MKAGRDRLIIGLLLAAAVIVGIIGVQRSQHQQRLAEERQQQLDQAAVEETHRILWQELRRVQEERRRLIEDLGR